MKLAQLETFVVVAEELHFRRAAERLYTQPSTVSTQISQLEAEYGTPLFIRNSRNVTLSPAGHTLLEKAKATLASVEDLERTARLLATEGQDQLTVGAMDEGVGELTEVVDASFRARRPNTELTLHAIDYQYLGPSLHSGTIDVALTVAPDEWFDDALVRNVPLFADTVSAVLPRRHRLATRHEVEVEELLDEPFLRVEGLHDAIHRRFHLSEQRDPARSPDVPVVARHMVNVLTHIARGIGIITVTSGTASFFPRPDVVFVRISDVAPEVMYASHRIGETRPQVMGYIEECINAVNTSLDLIPTATNATTSGPT